MTNSLRESLPSGVLTANVSSCLLCSGRGQSVYQGIHDRFANAPGEWNLFGCGQCGLLWLNPMPLPSEIPKLYTNYYTHVRSNRTRPRSVLRRAIIRSVFATRLGYTNLPTDPLPLAVIGHTIGTLPFLRHRIEREVLYLKRSGGGRLLDVGCGNGTFLKQMQALGWGVYGVEPDQTAAKLAREEVNCDIRCGTLIDAGFEASFFDAITLAHVIEHVPNPVEVLQQCYRLLKPGGSLVVATPNLAALGHKILRDSWRELDPPRHLYLFSPSTLTRCCHKAGFSKTRVVSSARNAAQIWATSKQIRHDGRMNPDAIPLALRMEGFVFQVIEALAQGLSRDLLCEEITLIATKN